MELRNFRERPILPAERQLLFCLVCGQSRANDRDMIRHLSTIHDVDFPEPGSDYLPGFAITRRIYEEDREAERFDTFMESLVGADDFLLECGDA